jgi:ribosome-associated translation inhibitor RaiA
MQALPQIAFHGLDRSEAIQGLIEEKVAWLEHYCDRLTGCRVVVEPLHHRREHSNPYRVRIDLSLPGCQVVVNRESHDEHVSLDALIRDAFDVARRGLAEEANRRRGE